MVQEDRSIADAMDHVHSNEITEDTSFAHYCENVIPAHSPGRNSANTQRNVIVFLFSKARRKLLCHSGAR